LFWHLDYALDRFEGHIGDKFIYEGNKYDLRDQTKKAKQEVMWVADNCSSTFMESLSVSEIHNYAQKALMLVYKLYLNVDTDRFRPAVTYEYPAYDIKISDKPF
jgi:hypothetical protein